MKRLLLIVFAFFALILLCIYIFIPAKIKFSNVIILKTKANIAGRFLLDENNWQQWFPATLAIESHNSSDKIAYHYKDYSYSVGNKMMNAAEVSVSNYLTSLNSLISIIALNDDSVAVEWSGEMAENSNPINRIKNYINAKELHSDMADILKSFQSFVKKEENIYGFKVNQQQVKDTILISTKYFSSSYPSTSEIYSLINDLRKYISKEGAEETNPPMLNIKKDSNTYRAMVAIPISKIIPETNNYVFKRMVPGKILVAEVKGGETVARQALQQIDLYLNDHQLSSPAIPFESLITERPQEPDTTKWVTKIYYPIY